LSETFVILRRIERDAKRGVHGSSGKSARYSCQILMKLEFCWQILGKSGTNFVQIRPL
jgi:hypothetical protein